MFKIKKIFIYLFIIICFCLVIFSGYKIIVWWSKTNENDKIKDNINKNYVKDNDDDYEIDFNKLKKINKDVVGYIKVKGTNIDYVVVKTRDNDYYLTHNFNKEYSQIGWVFMDYRNRLDDSDMNSIIYAHNTVDGSMFGSLKNVLKEKWQKNKNNHIIYFITEKSRIKYKVFSTYEIEKEDYYITTDFKDNKEYAKFLSEIIRRSNYKYKVNINPDDKILTLSTCAAQGKKRVVLHAKRVD